MSKYFINANGDYFETVVVPTDAQIATHKFLNAHLTYTHIQMVVG
jgi:hypothetical protein